MRRFALVVSALALSSQALAQDFHLNIRADISDAPIRVFGEPHHVFWGGWEGEMERRFSQPRLSLDGVAIGLRKEGQYYTGGIYLSARAFWTLRRQLGPFKLEPSAGLVYGLPGASMSRSDVGAWVFPVSFIDIPKTEVKGDGILYPEFSLAFRATWWRLHAEPVVGFRFIKFGMERGNTYKSSIIPTPTLGVRIGVRLP